MGDIYSPRSICTEAVLYVQNSCCLSVLTWYDEIPPQDTFFDTMPMGIIDFSIEGDASFETYDQGDRVNFQPLQIEIYYEIEEADTTGAVANAMIWRLWWCLVERMNGFRYFNKTVDGSENIGGGVFGFPIESEELGIKCRYAVHVMNVWRQLSPLG